MQNFFLWQRKFYVKTLWKKSTDKQVEQEIIFSMWYDIYESKNEKILGCYYDKMIFLLMQREKKNKKVLE